MSVPIPGHATNVGAQALDFTNQAAVIGQSNVPCIQNMPEGYVYAPIGYIVTDQLGRLWIKKTTGDLNTGWCQLLCIDDLNGDTPPDWWPPPWFNVWLMGEVQN